TKVVAERLRGDDAVRSLEARATDAPTEALEDPVADDAPLEGGAEQDGDVETGRPAAV
ncbi:MAG: hypothetical protein RLZZ272_274, partial [Actinomycetota bacterium]